jgi:hypothetical protein
MEGKFLFIQQSAAASIVIGAWRRSKLRNKFKLFFIQNCFTQMETKAMKSCKKLLLTFMKPEVLAAWSAKPKQEQKKSADS